LIILDEHRDWVPPATARSLTLRVSGAVSGAV
jgi:hypothetical protein